jgi:hypothetical protein
VKLFYPNWSRKELRSLICKEVALESVVMTWHLPTWLQD